MAYKKTQPLNPLIQSGEFTNKYWSNLDAPIIIKEYGNVTHLDFSPVSPYNLAVTSSAKVQIYSSRSNEVVRNLNRFTKAANCGSFRSDGKLLVAGCDDNMVRLFEPSNRSLLRVFKGHTEPVLVTRFTCDNMKIMSASRDKSVRLWDIQAEKELLQFQEFEDYIKCGVTSTSNADIFLTGSYDHTAKIFDSRTNSCVLTVNHGHPIESVLLFPSNGLFLTAGSNVVKVWDVLAGGKQLIQLCHHHKTVMDLCFCNRHRQFMSASSDRHVKIYDVSSYQVVHSMDYPSNILSVAVSPDDQTVAVGMEGGLLSIEHRKKNTKVENSRKRKASSLTQHKVYKPNAEDMVVHHTKKEKLETYDKQLKAFQHSKALDTVLEPHFRSQFPEKTMGVMGELKRRGTLKAALAGRNPRQVQALLKFIAKNNGKPHYSLLLDVHNILLEFYGEDIAGNALLESSFRRVKESMETERSYEMGLVNLKGMLGAFLAMASSPATMPETTIPEKSADTETSNAVSPVTAKETS